MAYEGFVSGTASRLSNPLVGSKPKRIPPPPSKVPDFLKPRPSTPANLKPSNKDIIKTHLMKLTSEADLSTTPKIKLDSDGSKPKARPKQRRRGSLDGLDEAIDLAIAEQALKGLSTIPDSYIPESPGGRVAPRLI